MLKTPVLFIIFNRPDTTQIVFEAIRKARPAALYISADGPRENKAGEREKCWQARSIVSQIDWDCEVKKLFHERNLGCKKAVSSGIDWFFSQVDAGIILEDDCLPDPSFFTFCEELLALYYHDTRVMQICGSNWLNLNRTEYSYYFSQYGPIWGWASWRRAWKYYDVEMKLWPQIQQQKVYEHFCHNEQEAAARAELFAKIYKGQVDTWDFQWVFAKLIQSGLCATPQKNLIANIGCREDGTHITGPDARANTPVESLSFPLRHPEYVLRDQAADILYCEKFIAKKTIKKPNIVRRLLEKYFR